MMPTLRRLLPLVVALALTACQDKNTMIEPEPDDDAPRYMISTPGEEVAFDRNHVPGSRKAEEDAAMAELLSLLPNDRDRATMEELMNAPGVVALSVKDPREARLIRKIYEIRRADIQARAHARSLELARQMSQEVVVALVEQMPIEGARAMILRRQGRINNVILLSPDASAVDFADAVSTMFLHRREFGDMIGDPVRARVPERSTPINPEREARFQQRLQELHSARKREIEGVGEVQAISIRIGPVRASGQNDLQRD